MLGDGNWLPHGFKRAPSLFRAQAALGWGVVVALMALLGVVYLSLGSDSIVSGYRIQQMSWELARLQRENAQLEARIATFEAVGDLVNRAREMGFVPAGPDQIEYLMVDDYPPAPGEGVPDRVWALPDVPDERVPWWGRFAQGFVGWAQSTAGVQAGGQDDDY
jgi:hypothetical protein